MFKKGKAFLTAFCSLAIGFINGLLGSGGGMIAVPFFKKLGMDQRTAQANSIAAVLPVSIVSIFLNAMAGDFPVFETIPYAFAGLLGAIIGTFLLKKIKNFWLSKIFACFMIYAGVRLMFK